MYNLGIDLGGTNIVVGVVDENYEIAASAKRKTMAPRPASDIADDIAATCFDALSTAGITMADIENIGLGTPGAVNSEKGVISFANNLKFFDVDMGALLKERLGKHVYIENDANCAAYGEFLAGAGRGTKDFIAVTLGTGVGGGIIIDGKIYSGFNGAGGELGHTVIQMNGERCSCGRTGCFEAYASATALIRQTKQAMIRYPESIMWDIVERNIDAVDGKTAFEAMRRGDEAGIGVVDSYIQYLAVGIANIINTFQPQAICIGGGISKEGKNLTDPINRLVKGENYARNIDTSTEIKVAALGNDAGVIGAACLYKLH